MFSITYHKKSQRLDFNGYLSVYVYQVAEKTGNPLDKKYQLLLEKALSTGLPALISEAVFQVPPLRMAIKLEFLKAIDNACTELCKRKVSSVLRGHDYDHLANFSWSNILNEISTSCGDLLDILSTVTRGNRGAVIGMAYAMLMQARNHEMSLCQRINSVLLMDGGAKKQVQILKKQL